MNQRRRWVPTITFIPFVYLIGWLIVLPFQFFPGSFFRHHLSLIGTIVSFVLFLLLLPGWVAVRWKKIRVWKALGLSGFARARAWKCLLIGILWALSLLSLITFPAVWTSSAYWVTSVSLVKLLNGLFLALGVGFAEELIFRGWLWGELVELIGNRRAIITQALIFSLVHTRFDLALFELFFLYLGLFLLGLVLALRRIADNGSLGGCVGMHGGLVGIWFLLNACFVQFSFNAPWWLVGPGGVNANPLGGVVAICTLIAITWNQRTAFANAGLPFNGALKASSRGALP